MDQGYTEIELRAVRFYAGTLLVLLTALYLVGLWFALSSPTMSRDGATESDVKSWCESLTAGRTTLAELGT